MTSDYYKILNLSKNCTKEDIKKNYKQLALKWHPDRNKTNKEVAEEKFKKISEAYEVLIDDSKRHEYDNNSIISQNFFNNPNDIFNEMFKAMNNPFYGFMNLHTNLNTNLNTNINNSYKSITKSKIYSKNKFGQKIIKTEIKTRLSDGSIKIEIKEELI